MFKHAKQRDGNWYGEEKYAELFTFWKRCADSKSTQENNSHCDEAALPSVNINENYSLETSNIVVEKEKIEDENIFVRESVINEFVAQDVELVIESDINLSEITVDDMVIVEDSPESSNQALSNCLSNKDTNCKVLKEIELNSNPSTTIKNEDVKKPEAQHVSKIFKDILFYPKKEPAKPGKRQPKEKVPAVATGDIWRKWKKEKEDQKDLAEKIKKERKILREARTKIKLIFSDSLFLLINVIEKLDVTE
ncbi:uncharacterized protein LOC111693849 [Trichogramma pretiosum]|uniref:uncharacterized protein LOC111693849 n=1 Tax=Trichogramma pretiosum TaxID=7493 RepID=UPI000C71A69B|nr:uncharacterized protein LOC111693849 [Trichogramma pretiosum]